MWSNCPRLRQFHHIKETHIAYLLVRLVGMSNELNVRSKLLCKVLNVLRRQSGAVLLSSLPAVGRLLNQELDPFVMLLYRHGVDPEKEQGQA